MKSTLLTAEEKRDAIVSAAEDKKANYVTVIDLRGKTVIADFFVICSGTSNIHIRSIADGIMESLEKQGLRRRRIEGYSEAAWVLLDYADVIVHIMSETERDYYKLETLWSGDKTPMTAPLEGQPVVVDETEEDLDESAEDVDEDE